MNTDRLGFYLVGWKKFYNKTLALLESKKAGYDVNWVFNDKVYGSIDWTVPIDTLLPELYKKRALQLREQYDYLILYFSGGADSLNILRSFVDNNIFLDEIVMQFPEPVKSTFNETDKSNKNFYSEIKYQAIPALNGLQLHPNTKIRHQDFSKPLLELLTKDDWFDSVPLGTNISPAGIGRQVAQLKEDHILELCNTGKTAAQILGVDKPLVYSDGVNYFAYFSDVSAMHSPPVDYTQGDIFHNLYRTEFFYWTPDMPEIVVKQAQMIKEFCIQNPQAKSMIMKTLKTHIQTYKSLLHSIIYPKDMIINWDPEKPSMRVVRPMDEWFWKTASDQVKGNYLNVIDFLKLNTDSKYMIDNDIQNGVSANLSRFYKL
jgi:hypothetical protein